MKTLKLIFTVQAFLMIAVGCGGGGGGGETAPAPVVDATAPRVETYYPDPLANGKVASANIQSNGIKIIFNEGMDATTIDSTSFRVEEWVAGGPAVSGIVTYDASVRTAKFVPATALASYWDYFVTVTTVVTDLAGNHLAVNKTWSFTVADAPPPVAVP
jgi:hypothetical protein